MTFVYFWLVCGLLAFSLHLLQEYNKGKDGTIGGLVFDAFSAVLFGPVGLVIITGISLENAFGKYKDKVIIKGRKK